MIYRIANMRNINVQAVVAMIISFTNVAGAGGWPPNVDSIYFQIGLDRIPDFRPFPDGIHH